MLKHRKSSRRLSVAAALAVVAALVLAACSTGSGSGSTSSDSPSGGATVTQTVTASSSGSTSPAAPASSTYSGPVKKVHLSTLENDGTTWGVGMPIIIYAKPAPTDSSAFTHDVTVTVNGKPANGAWFWEQPSAQEKQQNMLEAHYRPQHYWPAHSTIKVEFPLGGQSAGKGLVYDGALTSLTLKIGASHISTVNGSNERMTVTSDGKQVAPPGETTIPVSLGKASTPTYNGVKVVMQKGEANPSNPSTLRPDGAVRMVGPGYDEIVDWSVRITNSGEYVHAAPWNSHIGQISTSNGCTNLSTSDAEWFYKFSQIGDVVQYYNTPGQKMPSWDGYGDWNVPWLQWQQGGLLLTH